MRPFILALATLLLFGCGSAQQASIALYNPYSGSEGTVMDFIKSAPPDEVYKDTNFKVGVTLWNKGAIDVNDAVVSLSFLDKYFRIQPDKRTGVALKGKSIIRRSGEKKTVFFDAFAREAAYDLSTPITATLCYSYITRMVDEVCVDPDIYGLEPRQKACAPKDLVLRDQGAPVAVTGVEQSLVEEGSSVRVYEKITLKNLGTGLVANTYGSAGQLCSSSLSTDVLNRVRVHAELGGRLMDCGPSGGDVTVKLEAGVAQTTCSAVIQPRNEYVTPLKVELSYGYSDTLPQKQVIILPSP